MKKISIIAGLATLAGLFAGCIKEEAPAAPATPEIKMVEITLSTDSYPVINGVETKTQLVQGENGLKVYWKKGDKVRINDAQGEGTNFYVLTNTREDGPSASFTGEVPEAWTQGGTYHLFYPYVDGEPEGDNRIKGTAKGYKNHCTSIRYPSADQGLKAGSFGDNANASIAQVDMTTKKSLKFINPAGLYEFKLRGAHTVSKVELVSTTNIALTRATNTNLFYDYSEDASLRRIWFQYLNSTTVTLTNEEGIVLGDDYTTFYASVAPYTAKNTSLTIKVYEKGNEATPVFSQTIANVNPVESGKITRLGEFSVFESEQLYFRPSRAFASYDNGTENGGLNYFELPTDKVSGNVLFAAYFTDESYSPMWLDMTDSDYDGVYECNAPITYSNVTFVCMNAPREYNVETPRFKTSVIAKPAEAGKVYVLNDEGNGGDWISYVPVTKVYFKPNARGNDNFGTENGIKAYSAYFKTSIANIQDAVIMKYDAVNDIWYIEVPFAGKKYSQVSFIATKSDATWNDYWGMRTLFMDIPLDGKNLFTMEDAETAIVPGTWSVKE